MELLFKAALNPEVRRVCGTEDGAVLGIDPHAGPTPGPQLIPGLSPRIQQAKETGGTGNI